jgi:PHD/YefM family antitoxin component YafN of YafNO toxin-antitoxin module
MRTDALTQSMSLSRLRNEANDISRSLNDQPLAITKHGKIVAYLILANNYEALLKAADLDIQTAELLNIRAT